MKTRTMLTFGASALLFGGTMVGCAAHSGGVASASTVSESAAEHQAVKLAQKANEALGEHDADDAIGYAEAAVQAVPRDAAYRTLLGQAYLEDGRFTSARQAFTDALTLDSNNGTAALSLALAQTAEGDWAGARQTLDEHAGVIPAADRGLALALAGDPKAAINVLVPAARQPGATPKTRQNLALALALAGNWQASHSIAMIDLSPADVDARMEQWAAFATPKSASDQVAALLGVTPQQDQGQPIALALNTEPSPVALASAEIDAIDAVAVATAEPEQQPSIATAAAVPVATSSPSILTRVAAVVFGPRKEVVQPLPVRAVTKKPIVEYASGRNAPATAPRELAPGKWFVQLGAYENAAVAHDGWKRAQRVLAAFKGQTPHGMHFAGNGGEFYRLSVGGFTQDDAVGLCRRYKAKGGRCFVRQDAGDQLATWIDKDTQLASR
jgi:Flp pilus assembly protein TadD